MNEDAKKKPGLRGPFGLLVFFGAVVIGLGVMFAMQWDSDPKFRRGVKALINKTGIHTLDLNEPMEHRFPRLGDSRAQAEHYCGTATQVYSHFSSRGTMETLEFTGGSCRGTYTFFNNRLESVSIIER
jgi:hypothetical protein